MKINTLFILILGINVYQLNGVSKPSYASTTHENKTNPDQKMVEIDPELKKIINERDLYKNNLSKLSKKYPNGFTVDPESKVIDISNEIERFLIPLDFPFNRNKELILAFTPNNYHTFIVAGDLEYHATIYPAKNFYRYINEYSFRSGLFIRFPEVTEDQLLKVKNYIRLMDGHKTDLCVFGSLEVLARGADIMAPKKGYFSLKKFVKSIMRKGFHNSKNEEIPFQVIISGPKSIKKMFSDMKSIERKFGIFGIFGVIGARLGRLSKKKSSKYLDEHFFTHPEYPMRRPKPEN